MGSAAAIHSITTLSPATTVVFSGAATMVTSPPAGWEPNVKNLKKVCPSKMQSFQEKKEHVESWLPSGASLGSLMCGNGLGPAGGEKQVLLLSDYRIFTKETNNLPSKIYSNHESPNYRISKWKTSRISTQHLNELLLHVASLDETRHCCPQKEQHQHSPSHQGTGAAQKESSHLATEILIARCWIVNCNAEGSWLRPGLHLAAQKLINNPTSGGDSAV